MAAGLRCTYGRVPGSAGDVEDVLAATDTDALDQTLANRPQVPLGNRGEVARRPCRSAPLLELGQSGYLGRLKLLPAFLPVQSSRLLG
jgi:hypothetical protein